MGIGEQPLGTIGPAALWAQVWSEVPSVAKVSTSPYAPSGPLAPGPDLLPWWMSESRLVMPHSLRSHGLQSPRNSPGQNTGVGSLSLLQGIFPTHGSNPSLPQVDYLPERILEWVAYPFSSGSSRPRNQTRVSCIAGGFFTSWDTREALKWLLKVDHNMPQGHLPAHWITNFQSSAPQWKKWFSHFLNLLGGGPSHRKRLTIHSDPNFWLLSAYPPNTWIKEFRPEQSSGLGFIAFTAVTQVQSLVRDLRSCKLSGATKEIKM